MAPAIGLLFRRFHLFRIVADYEDLFSMRLTERGMIYPSGNGANYIATAPIKTAV